MMSDSPKLPPINFKSLARSLTIVENDLDGAKEILTSLTFAKHVPTIGITGPPGAGKSTLVNSLITEMIKTNKAIAVLAIDPTSPFNYGSLLGDRIRMNTQFNNPNVYIRSLATRGALGGLSAKTIEMADVIKSAGFDYLFIETVGVGQSEVEIATLADITILVLVPESGDEIQNMKSGIMEIASIFVVNKADRAGADDFVNHLSKMINQHSRKTPIIKTSSVLDIGIDSLVSLLSDIPINIPGKENLLANRACQLIQQRLMSNIDKIKLQADINEAYNKEFFNLYHFIEKWLSTNIKNS